MSNMGSRGLRLYQPHESSSFCLALILGFHHQLDTGTGPSGHWYAYCGLALAFMTTGMTRAFTPVPALRATWLLSTCLRVLSPIPLSPLPSAQALCIHPEDREENEPSHIF
jgi:hypothetical protein